MRVAVYIYSAMTAAGGGQARSGLRSFLAHLLRPTDSARGSPGLKTSGASGHWSLLSLSSTVGLKYDNNHLRQHNRPHATAMEARQQWGKRQWFPSPCRWMRSIGRTGQAFWGERFLPTFYKGQTETERTASSSGKSIYKLYNTCEEGKQVLYRKSTIASVIYTLYNVFF